MQIKTSDYQIETDYVYSQHDGGWYAEQARWTWNSGRKRCEFRVSRDVYHSRNECADAVRLGIAEFNAWN